MSDPNFEMKSDSPFCGKAERSGVPCRPCFNGICTIKGQEQRLYKGHDIHDTVHIQPARTGGKLLVETDIEVPFSVNPMNSPFKIKDTMRQKEMVLTMALGPGIKKLAEEKKIQIAGPWYHQHYRANALSDIAALHVHVQAQADTFQQAKELARELFATVDPKRLSSLIE